MNTQSIVLLVLVIVAVVIAVWAYVRLRRTRTLKVKFGPEYDRAVRESGSILPGEKDLRAREKRVAEFHIRPLTLEERASYSADWRAIQEDFVDDPAESVTRADQLIERALENCGYRMSDFDQQAADLSVEHPGVVEHFRAAHTIVASPHPSTEDFRIAMQHCRALFAHLVEAPVTEHKEVTR
jgi:hypothetical protein